MAQALEGLGSVKFYQGDGETARKLLAEALRIAQGANLQGSERARLALIKSDLGFVVTGLGDLPKGEGLMRASVAEFRKISAQSRWELGAALFGLGMAALNKNQLDEASKFLAESEQIYRDTLGDKNIYLGGNLRIQAIVFYLKTISEPRRERHASRSRSWGAFPQRPDGAGGGKVDIGRYLSQNRECARSRKAAAAGPGGQCAARNEEHCR